MEDEFIRKMNETLSNQMERANRMPLEEFDNLSPTDMHRILYQLFKEGSPVQYAKQLDAETTNRIPFYQLFRVYLEEIAAAGELKLTAREFLPPKLCKKLYGLGLVKEEDIESGIINLNREEDSISLQNLKIIGNLSGITKKRNKKLSLTRKGEKLMAPGAETELFKKLFETNLFDFNMGYHDLHETRMLQSTVGYTIYLLLRYGAEKRDLMFYSDKVVRAFPQLLDEFAQRSYSSPPRLLYNCYETRFFVRFLDFYGFVELEKSRKMGLLKKTENVTATPLFRSVFEIEPGNFNFLKNNNEA